MPMDPSPRHAAKGLTRQSPRTRSPRSFGAQLTLLPAGALCLFSRRVLSETGSSWSCSRPRQRVKLPPRNGRRRSPPMPLRFDSPSPRARAARCVVRPQLLTCCMVTALTVARPQGSRTGAPLPRRPATAGRTTTACWGASPGRRASTTGSWCRGSTTRRPHVRRPRTSRPSSKPSSRMVRPRTHRDEGSGASSPVALLTRLLACVQRCSRAPQATLSSAPRGSSSSSVGPHPQANDLITHLLFGSRDACAELEQGGGGGVSSDEEEDDSDDDSSAS